MITIKDLPDYQLLIIELISNGFIKIKKLNKSIEEILELSPYLSSIQNEMKSRPKGKKTSLGSTHGVNIKYTMETDDYGVSFFCNEMLNIVNNLSFTRHLDHYEVTFASKKDFKDFLIICEGKPFNSILFDSSILKEEFKKDANVYPKITMNIDLEKLGLGKNSSIFQVDEELVYLNKESINYTYYYDFKTNDFLDFNKIKNNIIEMSYMKWLNKTNICKYNSILYTLEEKYHNKVKKFSKKLEEI